MALFDITKVRIAGISACVPKQVIRVEDSVKSADYDSSNFAEKTGIKSAHISNEYTASDLCYNAAEKLINDLEWNKTDVGALFFVSQHPDYILPATSCILQERLGLSRECYAIDISLGCSGWVYGLSSVAAILSQGGIKKALLLVGDARKRALCEFDPLFGYAGTVTALEYTGNESDRFTFHFGTDGSGYDAIIIPDGGSRNPVTLKSFDMEDVDGKKVHRLQTRMKGMDVFAFGISVAPKSIKKIVEFSGKQISDYDYFILHQANLMMNEKIRKKLQLDSDKVPYSLTEFGNTSSASIPLTILTQTRGKVEKKETNWIACGFGVGLSWGTVAFKTKNLVLSNLIEL